MYYNGERNNKKKILHSKALHDTDLIFSVNEKWLNYEIECHKQWLDAWFSIQCLCTKNSYLVNNDNKKYGKIKNKTKKNMKNSLCNRFRSWCRKQWMDCYKIIVEKISIQIHKLIG